MVETLPLPLAQAPANTFGPDAFPSSETFDVLNASLTASDTDRQAAIKQANAVFAFVLKNKAGQEDKWHIDLKDKGEVGKGLGEKPTGQHKP